MPHAIPCLTVVLTAKKPLSGLYLAGILQHVTKSEVGPQFVLIAVVYCIDISFLG